MTGAGLSPDERVTRARELLASCSVCPRRCGTDRLADDASGVCATGRYARVCSAFPHHGEEDCLRGSRGSGTIFFSRCNLGCVFCQNADISQGAASSGWGASPRGEDLDAQALANVMLSLERQGCHNINLVSPSHVVPQIIEALALAKQAGLSLPVVYNSGGYDALETLKLLDGWVEIYMPDLKLFDDEGSARLLGVGDYPQRAREALTEMQRQVGPLVIDGEGVATRGLLVRHLVLPNHGDDTAALLTWLAELHPQTYVNVMGQYRPAHRVGRALIGPERDQPYADIARLPSQTELLAARQTAERLGLRLDERV